MTTGARRILLIAAVLLAGAPASAGPEDASKALANAAAVRAKLPAPTPVISLDYEGDIVIKGLWAGEVHYTAKAAKVGTQVVWRVTERFFTDWDGIETRRNTMLHLGKDLSIISGSVELRREDETTALVISRTEKGFFLQRRHKKGDDWKAPELIEMDAPKDATHGMVALLLFLRAAPADDVKAAYALPRVQWPFEGAPAAVDHFMLGVAGTATFGKKKRRKSWTANLQSGGSDSRILHLTPDRASFLGSHVSGTKTGMEIVPRGEGGQRLRLQEQKPATTWKAAFLKFGYGYHQARRNLLDAAFHWDRMYEHETKVSKRWSEARPLEDFKKAWIDEFCANSKRRSPADTKRLLDMTLATGKIKKKTKDKIVFAAHANFGGGTQRTYYLEKHDDVWGIVRIDFEE